MTNEITFTEDVLDSRDIIERYEELKEDYERFVELSEMDDDERTPDEDDELEELEQQEFEEYKKLKAFVEEAEGYWADWHYGEQFIRDGYFVEYAEELARDCCDVSDSAQWPHSHIDWESAAEELKIDFSSVEVDGETYWARM